jgi:hypothetical protein
MPTEPGTHARTYGMQRALARTVAFRGVTQLYHEAASAPTEWERGVLLRDADAALDALIERTEGWNDGYGSP